MNFDRAGLDEKNRTKGRLEMAEGNRRGLHGWQRQGGIEGEHMWVKKVSGARSNR